MVAVIRVLIACGGSPLVLLWQPVVVTAAKELPPGVHSVQVHREQTNTTQSDYISLEKLQPNDMYYC